MYRGENHGNAGAREYTITSSRGAATIYTSTGRIQQPAQQQQQHASTRSTVRELQTRGCVARDMARRAMDITGRSSGHSSEHRRKSRTTNASKLTHTQARTHTAQYKTTQANTTRSAISQLDALGGLGNSRSSSLTRRRRG